MKKKLAALLALCLCICLLSGCKKTEETIETDLPQDEEETVTYTFGFSCISLDDPYYIELESQLRTAVEAEGHTLITRDAKSDTALQETQIDELIEAGIDAIFLSPVDWMEITTSIDKLNEAGIKIINLDTQVQALDKVDAYVGANNTNSGYLCGQDLLERVPEGGKIIIVECPNRNSVNERIKGFEKAIAKKGFEVVARIDGKGDLSVTLTEVEEALNSNPDVVAIMCGNDQMALGALVAANTVSSTLSQVNNVIIYGIDGSPEIKQEIAKDNAKIVATVAMPIKAMSQEALTVALQILNNEKYESVTYLDAYLVTADTLWEYQTDTWYQGSGIQITEEEEEEIQQDADTTQE